jgi:hypothetical protein
MHQCVVVALSDATRNSLAHILKSRGIDSVLLASLADLNETLSNIPVSGILIELSSFIIASPQDKKVTQELLDLYPSAKFRFLDGQVLIVGKTLEEYLEECRLFPPRLLRKFPRKNIFVALYLSTDPTFLHAEKTVTINVSTEGYFVFSVGEWQIGDHIWLRFLDDDAILHGTIRSLQPWGNNQFLPGIGIQLDEI